MRQRQLFRALIFCCLLIAAARPAAAEWQITPLVGITFKGNTSLFDPDNATGAAHKEVGVAVTFLTRGLFGAEAVASLTPGFFQAKGRMSGPANALVASPSLVTASRTWALMGNAVLTAPRRYTEYGLRPFVSGGLGLLRAWETDPVINANDSLLGFNIGGGAIGFFTARTGVRFDLRYYANVHRGAPEGTALAPKHLRYMVLSVGLVFRTSGAP